MKNASILVQAFWDDDAKVWVATSNDIEGLSVEGATHEELTDKVVAAVADLIELNGVETDLPEIPVHIMTDDVRRGRQPAARLSRRRGSPFGASCSRSAIPYSKRRTSIGSTRVARRAGSQQATSATATSTSGAANKVSRSSAATP